MKKKIEGVEAPEVKIPKVNAEKERLLVLYETLKTLGINSISDLENKIANIK